MEGNRKEHLREILLLRAEVKKQCELWWPVVESISPSKQKSRPEKKSQKRTQLKEQEIAVVF